MELKKVNMINYLGTMHPILRHGFYDNWIGRKLNRKLYSALGPFENMKSQVYPVNKVDIDNANAIANSYGIKNLGEFIAKFPKDSKANDTLCLRTVIYFAINAINQNGSENYFNRRYNNKPVKQSATAKEVAEFYQGVLNILNKNFDFLSAATLLQAPNIVKYVNIGQLNSVAYEVFCKLCAEAQESEESTNLDTRLTFEEKVYGIFSLFSAFNAFVENNKSNYFTKEDNLIECAIDVLDSLKFMPSSNLQDTPIYLMLAYLFEIVPDINSSKRFKNKEQHKKYKKIHSIIGKPLKSSDIEDISNVVGFSKYTAIYLNYLAYQNLRKMYDRVSLSKLPQSSIEKIRTNLVMLLESEYELPSYLYKDLIESVYRPSNQSISKSEVVCKFFLKTYTGTMSRKNLLLVTKKFGLSKFKSFMTEPRWAHLFNEQSQDKPNSTTGNVERNIKSSIQHQNVGELGQNRSENTQSSEQMSIDNQSVIQSRNIEPEVVIPSATQSRSIEPEVIIPSVTQPRSMEPEVVIPSATQHRSIEPEVIIPSVTQPRSMEPEVIIPSATQHRSMEPEVIIPSVTQYVVRDEVITNPNPINSINREIVSFENPNTISEFQNYRDVSVGPKILNGIHHVFKEQIQNGTMHPALGNQILTNVREFLDKGINLETGACILRGIQKNIVGRVHPNVEGQILNGVQQVLNIIEYDNYLTKNQINSIQANAGTQNQMDMMQSGYIHPNIINQILNTTDQVLENDTQINSNTQILDGVQKILEGVQQVIHGGSKIENEMQSNTRMQVERKSTVNTNINISMNGFGDNGVRFVDINNVTKDYITFGAQNNGNRTIF